MSSDIYVMLSHVWLSYSLHLTIECRTATHVCWPMMKPAGLCCQSILSVAVGM